MSNSSPVTTSTIITLFNSSSYLNDLIGSLASQTRPLSQIIFVDDGSTDETIQCLKELLKNFNMRFSKILVLKMHMNSGVASAFNVGLKHVVSDILFFTGHDDIWMPNRVERTIQEFLTDASISFLHSSYLRFGDIPGEVLAVTSHDELIASMLFGNAIGAITVAIDLRKVEKSNVRLNPRYEGAEDYDLWADLILSGHKVKGIPEILMKYRTTPSTLSRSFDYRSNPVDLAVRDRLRSKVLNTLSKFEQTTLIDMLLKLRRQGITLSEQQAKVYEHLSLKILQAGNHDHFAVARSKLLS